ncbi:ATP-dependent DNA helicase PcrA [Desulforamulus reducens MI-1]|uniref:ATP-dependent DNA helicase n=1 Tax=Desulforamulus reducens (strain ATCC BAA-1160 / DSM 100696 / MI-1) TaxID=349161 RepID=A4J705_DESRM|nr:DNA helicase PcrA [Desulforamulus reducens]ABO50858.1 ATP-dependent DNA helicase PcrA [Desulforamulus reducens MI-1]
MNILSQLNPAQEEAVQHTEGPLLVLAGAGSGKTRVLTHRIAQILSQGVRPYNILAITFTNKAANEMRARVENLVPQAAKDLWVTTFHSACLRILRREIDVMGYGSNFSIYDDADQQTVIKECLKELEIDEKRFQPRAMLSAISGAKNKLQTPAQYDRQAFEYFEQVAARVYRLYQEKLFKNNAVDFDDLIMLTVRLFKENPDVLAYYQNKFKYILVDEYQDTNHTQYVLVNMLAESHRNVCVVGDPNQSIYKWRGADINNILDFERDYPEAKVVKLEQNYRSTGNILQAANAVIKNNAEAKDMKLWTSKGEGNRIHIYRAENERFESMYIADRVKDLRFSHNRKYRDMVILYRTHAQSRVFEEVFLRQGIPYSIFGGQKFYDRKEIKDLLSYLRVIANPVDSQSLLRIINVPKRGVGAASIEKLTNFATERDLTVLMALALVDDIPGVPAKARKQCRELADNLASLKKQVEFLSVTEITEEVLNRTGYKAELELENTVEARTRLENLQEFLTVTKEYDKQQGEETGGLADFLSTISLVTDLDRHDPQADQITLMTLHSAKGLEYPVVFLTGMEEGVFPHSRALYDEEELEEERRLAYVGITRAEEELYITHCWERTLFGRTNMNAKSRFLEEIPLELTVGQSPVKKLAAGSGLIKSSLFNKTGTIATQAPAAPAAVPKSYLLGDKVRHAKWGDGVIVKVKGNGGNAEITVAFPEMGLKTLIAQYAPLEKI